MAEVGPGEVLSGRFELVAEVGRGGMGQVWRAIDRETGATVAVKLLHGHFADDPAYRDRFAREVELAQRVASPWTVRVLGYGARDGTPYLVQEFAEGDTLAELVRAHGPYAWPEVRELLASVARALADVHAAGVVHRDVKPSNIMVGPDGSVRLTDFGIARALDLARMTGVSTVLGTPAYLAPEGQRDERSDLYALGAVAYEALAGSPPFEADSTQGVLLAHLTAPPDLSRVPAEARPTVAWLLAKDPARRPQTAGALLAALEGTTPVPPLAAVPGATVLAPRPPAAEAAFCPACGATRVPGSRFCAACGTDLLGAGAGDTGADRLDGSATRPTLIDAPRHVPTHRSRARPFAAALLAVVVVAGGGLAGVFALSSGAAPAASPGPEVTATKSPAPVRTAAAPVAEGRTGMPPTFDPASMESLRESIPSALGPSCEPASQGGQTDLPSADAVAALECTDGRRAVVYERLPDAASAQRVYGSLLSGAGVMTDSGGCWDATPGEVEYSYGHAACWTDPSDGSHHVVWTFDPGNVVAAATGPKALDTLVEWWWFHTLIKPPLDTAGLTPDEQFLRDKVPASIRAKCKHYDPLTDKQSVYKPIGSLGSIDCYPKGMHLQNVGSFRFTTPASLDAWYAYRFGKAELVPGSGGCFDGTAGETTWEHGRIACFVDKGTAKLRWTDDRYLIYGTANATDNNLARLVAWWQAADWP